MKTMTARLTALLLVLLLLAAPALAFPQSGEQQLLLLEEILDYVHTYALFPPDGAGLEGITAQMLEDDPMLFSAVVEAWLEGDPYGYLVPRFEYDILFSSGPMVFGIGIEIDTDMPLGLYVRRFLPGGGAEKTEMKVGAQIVSADGADLTDMPHAEARLHIVGAEWTTVEIGYINPGSSEVFTAEITRGALHTENVRGHVIEGTDIGYISISRFGSIGDYFDFDRLYHDALPQNGAVSVIIDLRGNPGGQLDTLYYILNLMLPDDGLLLFELEDAEGSVPYRSMGWDMEQLADYGLFFWQPERIVVLADEYSASASEVFAGALQTHGLAVIVGQTTFGKSFSQYHLELSSSDILIITGDRVALYEIGCYEDIGISPDYEAVPARYTGADFLNPLDTGRALFRQSVLTERILAMQERLAALGYYRAQPSGVFDDYTLWCLNRFQVASGLPQGRFANTETLQALDQAAMEKEFMTDTPLELAIKLSLGE
jgi:carboxyl-terminal processing protease